MDIDLNSIRAQQLTARLALYGVSAFVLVLMFFASTFIVEPGHRGVLVTMGKVSPTFAPEGMGIKAPFVTTVIPISVRQQTKAMKAECFSSDLQQVNAELNVLYRIPEKSVVSIYQDFSGDPFDSLIAPRIHEAIKEVAALQSAEAIVKQREDIKIKALAQAKIKIGDLLFVEDIVIQNISLSEELENAIEAKMVQEQEAAKARFIQQKTEIEASTVIIKAKGEAEAIRVRGQALRETPQLVQLQIVEKWDGKAPLVVGGQGGGSASFILPLDAKK